MENNRLAKSIDQIDGFGWILMFFYLFIIWDAQRQ